MLITSKNAIDRGQAVEGGKAEKSDAPFCYPPADTVKGRVLADLLSGMYITHRDVWLRHGSSRAAHHVYVLRRECGWPIQVEPLDVPTSDGRTAHIAQYWLPAETIRDVGTAGREYVSIVSGRGT